MSVEVHGTTLYYRNVIQAILMWMLSGALIDFAAIADSTDVFAIAGLLG